MGPKANTQQRMFLIENMAVSVRYRANYRRTNQGLFGRVEVEKKATAFLILINIIIESNL